MKRNALPALLCLAIALSLVACTSAAERQSAQATEIAASIFATQTAQAPTITPTPTATFTPTPTDTPTPTPTPTDTPTPTPTSTPTPVPTLAPEPTVPPVSTSKPTPVAVPLKEGWLEYATGEFRLALPERWQVVDVTQEGIEAILDLVKNLNTDWAQNITQMISAETMQKALRLWAMDPEPAGIGYATANVILQEQPFPMRATSLLTQLESAYKQFGLEVLSSEGGLEINGLEAGHIVLRLAMGPFAVQEDQYLYVRGKEAWMVTLAVDETAWESYEPIFDEIAHSFRLE